MEKHKTIDMHTHTSFSDGTLTPSELLSYGKRKGLETISITDHDTILGYNNLTDEDKKGMEVISGTELTAKIETGRMHILGYDIDLDSHELNSALRELHEYSIASVIAYLEKLKEDHHIVFSEKDVYDILNAERNIGRPDLALLCIKYGYAATADEAFDKYLKDVWEKAKRKNKGITPKTCISLIKKANGIPVLAHPHSLLLGSSKLKSVVQELMSYGLRGIEVYHPYHTKDQIKEYLALTTELNLLISGGSDYHGFKVKPEIDLGSGIDGNIDITELTLLKHIRARR